MKDALESLATIVAVIGSLVAAFMAIPEFRRSIDQRRENLRWKRAEMAKICVDEIRQNPLSRDALKMLDWTGLTYERPEGGRTGQIDHDQRRHALRATGTVFAVGDDDPFIRDAFDALFDGFERLEHLIRIRLVEFDDVEPPFRYHVGKLAAAEERPTMRGFLQAYGFELASRFLERFDAWRTG